MSGPPRDDVSDRRKAAVETFPDPKARDLGPHLLAVTPPTGDVPAGIVDVWRGALHRAGDAAHADPRAGAPLRLAVLLRTPGLGGVGTLEDRRLWPLLERAVKAGLEVWLSCALDEATQAAPSAVARGVSGLQLRKDPSPASCERLAGELRLALPHPPRLARSTHGREPSRARACEFACVGAVFEPRTDKDPQHRAPPLGTIGLRAWSGLEPWVVAIGGIEAATCIACVEAGARGLAGIRAFFGDRADVTEDVAAFAAALAARSHAPSHATP